MRLLLECQDASTKSDISQHFGQLLQIASDFGDQPALIALLFEYLSTVTARLTQALTGAHLSELLYHIAEAVNRHRSDKAVQRASLLLYVTILQLECLTTQQSTARKVCRAVIDSIQHNIDDPSLFDVTHSAVRTLVDKQGAILAPWMDCIVGLVLTSIAHMHSAELVAKWLMLLERVATTHAALTSMAAHPRCLNVLAAALGILLDHTQMKAAVVALGYILRLLQDDNLMVLVLQDLDCGLPTHKDYFLALQSELRTCSDKFADLVAQATGCNADGALSVQELLVHIKDHIDTKLLAVDLDELVSAIISSVVCVFVR